MGYLFCSIESGLTENLIMLGVLFIQLIVGALQTRFESTGILGVQTFTGIRDSRIVKLGEPKGFREIVRVTTVVREWTLPSTDCAPT